MIGKGCAMIDLVVFVVVAVVVALSAASGCGYFV